MKNKKVENINNNLKQSVFFSNNTVIFFLLGIIAVSFIAYSNSFHNLFNYRDDNVYVLNNPLIRDLSWNGLKNIFTELYYNGHLPLTILSLAIDYHFWELDVFGYHVTSFLIHLLNIYLVYKLIFLLSNKQEVALLTALIFAIHPTGVQSVSWISERKNVLYATFFLASLIQYILYLTTQKNKHLAASLLLFIFSVASKWSAYTLPVVLLLIDWFFKKKNNATSYLMKAVFFAVPFISFALHMQSGAAVEERFTFIDRIFFGSYSYIAYLFKAILPYNLSTIYPYPKKTVEGLPDILYASFPALLLLLGLIAYVAYRFIAFRKIIIFGLLFFTINIGMVLNILMFIGGHEMMADRYGYIPFIGLFFIVSEIFIYWYQQKNYSYKNYLLIGLSLYAIFLSSYTYSRNKAWKDTITIYDDALEKYPLTPIAYLNKAKYYKETKQFEKMLVELDTCTKKFSYYKQCFYQRGLLYFNNTYYDNARKDFLKVIDLDKKDVDAYKYLSLVEINTNNFSKSIPYIEKQITLDTKNAMAYNNLGYAYYNLNNFQMAETYFNKSLALDNQLVMAYLNRGWMYIQQKKYAEAIEDFNAIIKIEPNNALAYNNKGWALYNLGNYKEAINAFNEAIKANEQLNYAYYNRALAYFAINNSALACQDLLMAEQLNHQDAQALLIQKCRQ